jgi:pilus assembly protein CpaB
MRSRGLTILLVAVLAGLGAAVLVSRYVVNRAPKVNQVAVAAKDVPMGGVLTPDAIRLVNWPEATAPKGAVLDAKKLVGRVVKTSVIAGELLFDSRLAPEGTRGGLSSLLAPGKRAMAVQVNAVVGVSGFALPGTYVDVLLNTTDDQKANAPAANTKISKIILERMLVLAIAQEVERDPTKPKVVGTVTLEVTPEQAETLDLARSVGSLSLVLRNQTETGKVHSDGATKAELMGEAPPAPAPVRMVAARPLPEPAAAPVSKPAAAPVAPAQTARVRSDDCIEVIRGMSRVTECF